MALKKTIGAAALASAVLALTGCAVEAPVPYGANYAQPTQMKVRAAGHWDLMASEVVADTLATLERNGLNAKTPLYVALPQNASAFDSVFHDLVVTKLVQHGASVYTTPGQQLEVSYDAKVVHHNLQQAGNWAYEGDNGQVVAGVSPTIGTDYQAATIAGAPAYSEVLLTTTVLRQGQYVARKSNVYYVDNATVGQFAKTEAYRAVNMKVVNK
ncbi:MULTISPECIES: hypothetical protein [Comamonas]|jgi:hypothetical protein|uniref:Lipoprotein n=1 Tax=Comamonas squillarum TaxID=2977320 RepID=A0ABY5ZXZ4_9BURK|nr:MULTISPECIES: hypothetical protein [Comamonas]UXC17600.1 hypothetical protein N4T19_18140 [Comamonas sp. PR12]